MADTYRIIFTGELLPGFESSKVVSEFRKLTGMDLVKASTFVESGKRSLIKKNISKGQAESYQHQLEKIGMKVDLILQEEELQKTADMATSKKVDLQPSSVSEERKEDPQEPVKPEIDLNNPYAAPKADLTVQEKGFTGRISQPQKCPASHGVRWITTAIAMFFKHPWKWMGMSVVAFLCVMIFSIIPLLGSFFNMFIAILFSGGFMLAAQMQLEGKGLDFGCIFSGFSHHTRNQLLMVALLYLGLMLIFGLVIGLVMLLPLLGMVGFSEAGFESAMMNMTGFGPVFIILMCIATALSIPLMMAFWFTPPLVALGTVSAVDAYKLSFRGTAKNWLSFLVYSLAATAMGALVFILFSIVGAGIGFFLGDGGSFLLGAIPILIALLLGFPLLPIFGLSMFTSFRDIYYPEANDRIS